MLNFKNQNFMATGIIMAGIITTLCLIQNECIAYNDNVNYYTKTVQSNDMDIEQYIRKTRQLIKNNWYPPTASFENNATMELKISRDGQLLNCHLSEPSNDDGFNESLIYAAQKTHFLPFPSKFSGQSIDISLSFGMARRHISKESVDK